MTVSVSGSEQSLDEEHTFPDEIEKWNNAEYKKGIEEYQAWKIQGKNLKHVQVTIWQSLPTFNSIKYVKSKNEDDEE